MQDDIVERSKAEAFLRNHAENCRIEGCHLTAERMDECADLLAQRDATILSLREQLEKAEGALRSASLLDNSPRALDYFQQIKDTPA